MQRSETIGKLFAALAKAQLAMDDASKDSSNPHFGSKYADLSSVREAIRRPFAENGLAYTQFARFNVEAKTVEVETMLVHGESGEFVSDTLAIPCPQATAHAIGSAITYGRRFSLMAVSGVAPAEDDDGNAAADTPPNNVRRLTPKTEPPKAPAQPASKPTPSTGYSVPAEGEPVAATLIEGIPHHMGLREITLRFVAGTKHAGGKAAEYTAGGNVVRLREEECTKAALDAQYNEWDAWRRSMWPQLPEAEQAKVVAALDGWSKVAKAFDAALAKRDKKRAADAAAAGANAETGEIVDEVA